MAVLFADSFDHYTTYAQMITKWTVAGASSFQFGGIAAGVGRFGGNCWRAGRDDGNGLIRKYVGNKTTLIAGCAFKQDAPAGSPVLIGFWEGGTLQTYIRANWTKGRLEVVGGAGTVIATGNIVIAPGIFYFIEFKATISNSTGTTAVRVNGDVDTPLTLTNVDTQASANAWADSVGWGWGNALTQSTSFMYADDFYICDDSGTSNNDFLGDIRVIDLFATSDSATDNAWVASPSGSKFATVDDATPNDDTDYISSATPNDRQTFGYGDISQTGTIKAVQFCPWARKDDAGTRTIAMIARIGTTDYDQANLPSLSSTYAFYPQVVELSPATGVAWTISEINGAEFGVLEVA